VPDLEPDPNQDPLARGTDPLIRIHTKMARIRNTAPFCKLETTSAGCYLHFIMSICAQVCALQQLGYLTRRLGTLSTSLLTEPSLRLLDTVLRWYAQPESIIMKTHSKTVVLQDYSF
jgi:hypothetical protein